MLRKIVSGLVLITLLVGMSPFAFNIQTVKTWEGGTIYIRADGSIDPPDAPINRANDIYTLYDDIEINTEDGIVIEKNNIIIDGAGHVLEGNAVGIGMNLSTRTSVVIKNLTIKTFRFGIALMGCSDCEISGNTITMSFYEGIGIYDGSDNNIFGNNITLNEDFGLSVSRSSYNTISNNKITETSGYGIWVYVSSDNGIYENDITHNGWGIYLRSSSNNNIITRNDIANNYFGIYFDESSDNNITRNEIKSNTHTGIAIENNSMNNHIERNMCIEGSTYYCIAVRDSNNTCISGNQRIGDCRDGISISSCNNNIISGNNIANNTQNIELYRSSNNTILGNFIGKSNYGIWSVAGSNNIIHNNTIIASIESGIYLSESSNNTISRNDIGNSGIGIEFWYGSRDSIIFHNNFFNNTNQVHIEFTGYEKSINVWDDGYPSGGNYWGDYTDIDEKRGANQDQLGSDGIGDIPYIIDADNRDRYPFIVPIGTIPVFHKETRYDCIIDGSMTVSRFSLTEDKTISFNVNGEGYVNLTIPSSLIDGSFQVFVDNTPKPCLLSWNETYNSIYFEHATSQPLNVKIEAKVTSVCPEDVNGDGTINILDIAAVAIKFGQTCP